MKKNINIVALFLVCASLFSCGDDDFSIAYTDNEVKVDLIGTLTLDRTEAAPTSNVGFTVTLPQTFEADATVQVTATSSFASLEIDPSTTIVFVDVPAGSTTGMGSFTMPGSRADVTGEFIGFPDYTQVSITGLALKQPEEGSVDDPFTMTSEVQSINSNDWDANWMGATAQTLKYSLDWQGPYGAGENDLDLYARSVETGTTFESSESGTRFEGDFFNNPANEVHPDGDYYLNIGLWTSIDDTPIPYRLVLTYPDGSVDLYTGVVDPAIGSFNAVIFTKTTDADGDVTFVSSAL